MKSDIGKSLHNEIRDVTLQWRRTLLFKIYLDVTPFILAESY
jgi:hypothetical protein